MNKTKRSVEVVLFCGLLGAVSLFDLPPYLDVQMVALAQKKGCQEG